MKEKNMPTYEQLQCEINRQITKYKDEMIAVSDHMADNPELSGREYETSAGLVRLLEDYGYKTEKPFCGKETAFRGVYGSNDHKYKIALLTEYDALPEIGHACGHCLSGAISMLAGLALKDLQDELDADVHIIGTPDEEDDGAKCIMA